MPLDRGPSPLRPVLHGASSYRRVEVLSPIDTDVHPVIHSGRVAVITGAASGIGRATAIELAKCVGTVALLLLTVEDTHFERRRCRRPHTHDPSCGPFFIAYFFFWFDMNAHA